MFVDSLTESVDGGHTITKNKGYKIDVLSPDFMHPNGNLGLLSCYTITI